MAVTYRFSDGSEFDLYRARMGRDGNRDLCRVFQAKVDDLLWRGGNKYGEIRRKKVMEISQWVLPIRWFIGDVDCKGKTLTQIGALPDGFYELLKLQRWVSRRKELVFVADAVLEALKQPHLSKEYQAALKRYKDRGRRIGKDKVYSRRAASEIQGRAVEYGLF